MAGRKKNIAGYEVEIWQTSFRIGGMSQVVHVGHHINDRVIEDIIHTISHDLKPQGTPVMNLTTMAALVRDDVTTITVNMRDSNKDFIFLCTRELADHLQEAVEPYVVVKTSRGVGTGIVQEVHDEPVVDAEDGRSYRWAFQMVDEAELRKQETITGVIEERLKSRRKQTRREQALAALGMSQDEVKALTNTAEKEA